MKKAKKSTESFRLVKTKDFESDTFMRSFGSRNIDFAINDLENQLRMQKTASYVESRRMVDDLVAKGASGLGDDVDVKAIQAWDAKSLKDILYDEEEIEDSKGNNDLFG